MSGTAREIDLGNREWGYQRHRPEQTLLYQLVEAYYPRLLDLFSAQGLKRVFRIDIETCDCCGDPVKVIASIEDPAVIKQVGIIYYAAVNWCHPIPIQQKTT